jgi:hypothetical protein
LLIDPDRELPCPVSSQGLKPVARQGPKGIEKRRGIQDCEPLGGLLLESLESPDKFALTELLCPFYPYSSGSSAICFSSL